MFKPIIDSSMTKAAAMQQNPNHLCPVAILQDLVMLDVDYLSFDNKLHKGQIVVHKDLAQDVKGAFALLLDEGFPIQSVIPVADARHKWDDSTSTVANNSSGFNYRYVRGTSELSNHARGRAIDINPFLNPYFPGEKVFPPGSSYNPNVPGTIVKGSSLVNYFANLGWSWGGDWSEDLDYQHFEKL